MKHFCSSTDLHIRPTPAPAMAAAIPAFAGFLMLLSTCSTPAADCFPPPTGLVSWWQAEGSTNDTVDGNSGVLVSGATYASGMVGQAFSFNGTGSYVRVADSPNLRFTSAMTIEAWIYPSSTVGYHNIVSKWDWSYAGAQMSYTTALNPGGIIGFGVCDTGNCPSGSGGVSSTTGVPVNQWTHFAVTYDGSYLSMYVNGVLNNQTSYSGGVLPGTSPLIIGAAVGGPGTIVSPFAGRIDEVSLYSRALSGQEVQAIYLAGSLGKCQPPRITVQPRNQVGYWGKSVTLSVSAAGAAPLAYQWLHEGAPVQAGTGSSLVLTNLQAADAGNYSVQITNDYGSVTSSNALVTVNPAGVSADLYTGITIDGVVGQTYGIQYTTNLVSPSSWKGIANVTLYASTQLWFDTQPANQPRRYYRVVPGPISIP